MTGPVLFLALGLAVCALGDAAAFCLTIATHPFSRHLPTPGDERPGPVPSPAGPGHDLDPLGAWIANHPEVAA